VRDAFLTKGHDAWSCDIFDTEVPGPHYKCKVQSLLKQDWDMMIAFPPCTYLASSGVYWDKIYPWRLKEREKALSFVKKLMTTDIEKIALENPVGVLSTRYRKPDQIIHPWQYGHGETKRTCLWLKNLPLLQPTNIVTGRKSKVQTESSGPNQARNRSRTYLGIAQAMADQWG
jgi:hypothetical protein